MAENPNLITIENSVVILIDHQPWVTFSVQSIDPTLLVNNVTSLATAAKAVGVPTILTTVGAQGGPLEDPILRAISEVFPDQEPIDRVSTNAWADIKPAVEATGRRVLAHEDGKRRMVQAGADGINWVALATEWARDYTTPERQALIPGMLARGGAVGLSLEYVIANRRVPAGSA